MRRLSVLVRSAARRMLRRWLEGRGYHMVRCTAYCPVPHLPPPSSAVWTRASDLPGIRLDLDTQLDRLASDLVSHLAEFRPPTEPTCRLGEFHLFNGYYDAGDAELLWAMIRHARPRRVIEVGAGYSTLVSAAACAANGAEGFPVELVSIDPEPRVPGIDALPALTRMERQTVTGVPLADFSALGRNDILFVDSSHVAKLASDVIFLILEVLPRLAPGVLVHFHDVFWPFEYPRRWLEGGTYLNEQYFLQAFLSGNDSYEILIAAHALDRLAPDRMAALIPSLSLRASRRPGSTQGPSALWLRRR